MAKRILAVGALVVCAACSTPDVPTEVHDPFEATNRKTHEFNKTVDRALVRPTSTAYGVVFPARVRQGVSNFANFIDTPRFIINDVAQGNIDDAGHNFMRFMLNGVFGLGLLDVAKSAGVETRRTGFGETLHVWGAEEGAYVELPFFGPSNQRDAVGLIVDFVSNPLSNRLNGSDEFIPPTANALDRLGQRFEFAASIDALLYNSADSYAQARSLYLQNRRFALGQEDEFAFDPYEDPNVE